MKKMHWPKQTVGKYKAGEVLHSDSVPDLIVQPTTGIRNQAGRFMLERGVRMGVKIDPGEVQTLITDFAAEQNTALTKELDELKADIKRLDGKALVASLRADTAEAEVQRLREAQDVSYASFCEMERRAETSERILATLKHIYDNHNDGRECFCPYCVALSAPQSQPDGKEEGK